MKTDRGSIPAGDEDRARFSGTRAEANRKLLCIGDSNTYGYDPRSYFGSGYPETVRWTGRLYGWEVLNCGINGLAVPVDGSVWQNLIEQKNPELITVMLGSNDLLEGCSAEETAGRMEAFIRAISRTGKRILLIAPPAMKTGEWCQSEEQNRESNKLTHLYRELADRLGTDFADAEAWNVEISFDGVHFTENGHKAFAKGLQQHLEEKQHE